MLNYGAYAHTFPTVNDSVDTCRCINRVEATTKVLEALAEAIAAEGIDHIFAVMGDANMRINGDVELPVSPAS